MIGIICALILTIVSLVGYYIKAKSAKQSKRTTQEANKDFDSIVVNQQWAPKSEIYLTNYT